MPLKNDGNCGKMMDFLEQSFKFMEILCWRIVGVFPGFYDVLCILLMESGQQSAMEFAVPSTSSPSQIVKLPYLGAPPQKSCFGRTCNACFFPRDWHIYLHERLIFMVNVGKCSLHGSYGYNGIANYPSNDARKIQKKKRDLHLQYQLRSNRLSYAEEWPS